MPEVSLLDLPGLRARDSAEPGFAAALDGVGQSLGLNPSYIGAVMSLESGFRPDAVNPSGGASGLIQFMPATAKLLGTTVEALRAMTAIQQLDYVRAYYIRAGHAIRPGVAGDYYMATFLPAFVGKPPGTVLAVKGNPIYDQNAGLDGDRDGVLTVGDVTQKIEERVAVAEARPLATFTTEKKKAMTPVPPSRSPRLVSPVSSSGQPSDCGSEAKRQLVVFAATCELEAFAGRVRRNDQDGIEVRIRAYWGDVLHQPDAAPHPREWCGAFALWCLHQAGLGKSLRWVFGPPQYGFLYNLPTTAQPKPGDVAYLDRPWQHHAIVVSADGGSVVTIDGNQGNAEPVKEHTAALAHWTAFYSIAPLLTAAKGIA